MLSSELKIGVQYIYKASKGLDRDNGSIVEITEIRGKSGRYIRVKAIKLVHQNSMGNHWTIFPEDLLPIKPRKPVTLKDLVKK